MGQFPLPFQAFRPTPEASSGFRRGRRADGGVTCSGLEGPVGQWAGRDHFAGQRQGSGGSWRLQRVQGDDPKRRVCKGKPHRQAGRRRGVRPVLRSDPGRAGGAPDPGSGPGAQCSGRG